MSSTSLLRAQREDGVRNLKLNKTFLIDAGKHERGVRQECVREGEQETEMRRVMGVSVVPALWKGMLQ